MATKEGKPPSSVKIIVRSRGGEKTFDCELPDGEESFVGYIKRVVSRKVTRSNSEIQLVLKNSTGSSRLLLQNIDDLVGTVVCNGTELCGILIDKKRGSIKDVFRGFFSKKMRSTKSPKTNGEDTKKKGLSAKTSGEINVKLSASDVLMPNSLQMSPAKETVHDILFGSQSTDKKSKILPKIDPLTPLINKGDNIETLKYLYIPTGLRNIGNTCFMNASLQLLFRCKEFIEPYLSAEVELNINKTGRLGSGGVLTRSFGKLVQCYVSSQESRSPSVSPRSFFGVFKKQCPNFSTLGVQQDAHEFITLLVDVLHEDTNSVTDKPIVDNSVTDFACGQEFTREMMEELEAKLEQRDKSVVFKQFNSLYLSTVRCIGCNTVSTSFQATFSHLLPIISRDTLVSYVVLRRTKDGVQPAPVSGCVAVPQDVVPFRRIILEIGAQYPELVGLHLVGVRFSPVDDLADTSYHLPTICYAQPDMIKASLFAGDSNSGAKKVLVITEVEHDPSDRGTYLSVCNASVLGPRSSDPSVSPFVFQSLPFVVSLRNTEPTLGELNRALRPLIGELSCFLASDGEKEEGDEPGPCSDTLGSGAGIGDGVFTCVSHTEEQQSPVLLAQPSETNMEPDFPLEPEKTEKTEEAEPMVEVFYCSYYEREHSAAPLVMNGSRYVIPKMTRDEQAVRLANRKCGRIDGAIRLMIRPRETGEEPGKLDKQLCCALERCQRVEMDALGEAMAKNLEQTRPDQRITAAECLENSLKTQFLSGENQYYCSMCRAHVDAVIDKVCIRWPQFLMMTLKRFKMLNERYGKDDTPVAVDRVLLLREGDMEVSYLLVGAIIHMGGLSGGHYISFVRGNPKGNKWFLCNDDEVTQVDKMNLEGSYVLMYQRLTTTPSSNKTGSPVVVSNRL